ncbi:MAG: chorismate mutase / prephenate dehydratase [Acidobacteriota bacterium]|jgi:antitoxin VapB|nr:chorismate mutase / prephenate dehydratase [Acidobacteriota bacterium]
MSMSTEIDEKMERLVRWMEERRLGGVLLSKRPNFAWITAGRESGIDLSGETGVATILVAADGRRFLLTNNIEMRRFLEEDLAGQGYIPVERPWTDEQDDLEIASDLLGSVPLASDVSEYGKEIARLRYRLTAEEIERFRGLGRDAGQALGEVCRGLRPGLTEREIGRRASEAMSALGADPIVLLVAAGERLARYRHPPPTDHRWEKDGVMVVVCARREGLIVALTRIVWAGPMPEDIRRRTRAAAEVNARLLVATCPGVSGRELFAVAARAYEELGYPGEERLHHQGGPCGYLSRDWIANPASDEVVQSPQAFAWNPSVTGTKVEETWIASEDVEAITATPGWPSLEIEVDGKICSFPDIAVLGNF